MSDAKKLLSALGRPRLCAELGVTMKAVSAQAVRGSFPAAWYFVMRGLADEKNITVSDEMFRWKHASGSEFVGSETQVRAAE